MTTSDHTLPEPAVPEPILPPAPLQPGLVQPAPAAPVECVSRGLAFAAGAIPVGMIAAIVIWKMGFVASISSFLIAGGAVFLYAKGAGTPPRKGIAPLVGVVVLGIVASFFGIVAADLMEFYGTPQGRALGYPTEMEFVRTNLFNGEVLKSYGSDLVMFVVFAALGIFGTLRRLLRAAPSSAPRSAG